MSLINDALKKAQKQRADPAGETLPPMPGGGTSPGRRVQKRGEPMRAQSIALLVGGTLTVLILAVGGGFYFLRMQKSSPETANAGTTLAPVPVAASSAATPLPASTASAAGNAPASSSTPVAATASAPVSSLNAAGVVAIKTPVGGPTTPEPTSPPLIIAVITPTPAPVVIAPTPSPTPAVAAPGGPNPLVYSFLDTLHVGGIRSSGNESRVLMNEHVYRVNDVVDHLLGLKLTKVGTDTLTFVDGTGAVYVKNF